MTELSDLAAEQFLQLTTFRRSGDPVATPVWAAPYGDDLVVTTIATTGKVKRIRHTPRVLLRPCTRSGQVGPDAPTVTAHATIVEDPAEVRRLSGALKRKYGILARLFLATDLLDRRRHRVMLRLTEPA